MPRYCYALLILVCFASCQKTAVPTAQHVLPGFPVKRYLTEQYKLYHGQPYPVYRIVSVGGKTDTTLTNFLDLDYPALAEPFYAGDISDTAFLGKYEVSEFDDDVTGNHTYQYTALDKSLYNQITIVSLDAETKRPAFLYQKNIKSGAFGSHMQQLTYIPRQYLQILDDEATKPGGARTLQVEYRFLRSEE